MKTWRKFLKILMLSVKEKKKRTKKSLINYH